MRILMVYPFFVKPKALGGVARIYRLIKFLAQRGHKIWLVCFDSFQEFKQADLKEVEKYCQEVKVIPVKPRPLWKRGTDLLLNPLPSFALHSRSSLMQKEIQRLIQKAKIQLLHIEFTHLGDYAQNSLDRVAKVLVDEELNFRAISRNLRTRPLSPNNLKLFWESWKFKHYELKVVTNFDKVFTTTEEERKVLLNYHPSFNVEVYPNTVDTEHFSPLKVAIEPNSLVFVGNFRHRPNEDGIIWFTKRVFPLILRKKPCRLYIIGAHAPQRVYRLHDGLRIMVLGYVEDIRPYLAKSSVFISPLINGGGMRGKTLEAMAMEKPVVSTTIGAEGINALSEKHLMIADKPDVFAKKVQRLFDDENLRRSLGVEARKLVQELYDDKVVFSRLEQAYRNLIKYRDFKKAEPVLE